MFAISIDIQDSQINIQTENIRHNELAEGAVYKVNVRFSNEKATLEAIRFWKNQKLLGFY